MFNFGRTALAVTGFVMAAYVLVHMLDNLLAFAGSATFNAYAASLREFGTPVVDAGVLLWITRVVLATTLVLHLSAHIYLVCTTPPSSWFRLLLQPVSSLWEETGQDSSQHVPVPPWYARLPLLWLEITGVLIAVFVAIHLAQMTIGSAYPAFVPGDAYRNLVGALGYWPVSIAYIAAAVAVGAHLQPGLWTAMRTLGLTRPGTEGLARTVSAVMPVIFAIGLSSVPIAVLFGLLK